MRVGAVSCLDLWYDTEAGYDIATFETSTDGTVSGFGGRVWYAATADVDATADEQLLRWRYDTDSVNVGRGVYLDGVRVIGPDGDRLDDTRAFQADSWTLSND